VGVYIISPCRGHSRVPFSQYELSDVTRQIDVRFFAIGCVLLVAAIGLAGWAFALGCISVYQEKVLLWALPLASGFAAGSFAGALTVKNKDSTIIPGLLVTASGGFGVWLITIYVLIPVINGPECGIRRAAEQRVIDISTSIRAEGANYERGSTKYPLLLKDVFSTSSHFAEELLNQPEAGLDARHQLTRLTYGSDGYLYSALAGDLIQGNKPDIVRSARSASDAAAKCLAKLGWLKTHAQDRQDPHRLDWDDAYNWSLAQNIGNYCVYSAAASLTLLLKYADGVRPKDIASLMETADGNYLSNYPPYKDPIFAWACSLYRLQLGAQICGVQS
jgi:hypothetical protein